MSTLLPRKDYPVEWIAVDDIDVVWADAQRLLVERNVRHIMEDFDPDALGVVIVAERNGHGRHHVIDGQHRVTAMKRLGLGEQKIPCLVRPIHDAAAAGKTFIKVNSSLKPDAISTFNVKASSGYGDEALVRATFEHHGWKIGMGGDGTAAAVNAYMNVHRRHGLKVIDQTLNVITSAWGHDRDGCAKAVFEGVAAAVATPGVDQVRLIERLSKALTPAQLAGRARSARDIYQGTLSHASYRVVLDIYNVGLRSGRIEAKR